MSSAPRMMTSQDLRLVSLSVRDPARPAGLPIPPCCRRILRYSLNLNGAITVRSSRELRAVGIATASARREPRSDLGEARTPRGRYRTRRWIGNRSSPVDVSNPSHALHGMPPSAQPGAGRRPRISAGRQRSSPHAPITGAAGRRNRVKIAAAMMVGHHANKDALHLRLRRIDGQVRGSSGWCQDEGVMHRGPHIDHRDHRCFEQGRRFTGHGGSPGRGPGRRRQQRP